MDAFGLDKNVGGDHSYINPPEAAIVVDCPNSIVVSPAATATGFGFRDNSVE